MKQIFKKLLEKFRKPKRLDPKDYTPPPYHPHCRWETPMDDRIYETDTVELGAQSGTVAPRPFTEIKFPEPAIPVEYVEPITLLDKRIGGVFRIADGVRPILTGDIDGFGETVREAATELVGEDVKFSVRSEGPEPSDEVEVIDVPYYVKIDGWEKELEPLDSRSVIGILPEDPEQDTSASVQLVLKDREGIVEEIKCLKMAHGKLDECDWADEPAQTVTHWHEPTVSDEGSLIEKSARLVTGITERPAIAQEKIDEFKDAQVSGFARELEALEKASTAIPKPSPIDYLLCDKPLVAIIGKPVQRINMQGTLHRSGQFDIAHSIVDSGEARALSKARLRHQDVFHPVTKSEVEEESDE